MQILVEDPINSIRCGVPNPAFKLRCRGNTAYGVRTCYPCPWERFSIKLRSVYKMVCMDVIKPGTIDNFKGKKEFRECSPEINSLNSKEMTNIAIIMGNYRDIVTIGGGKCHSVTRVQGSKWWEIKAYSCTDHMMSFVTSFPVKIVYNTLRLVLRNTKLLNSVQDTRILLLR